MSAALAFRSDGTEAALVFQFKAGAYNTESLIEFLRELHGHFPGEKVTVIWDGLPSHRSKAMKAWVATPTTSTPSSSSGGTSSPSNWPTCAQMS